MACLGQKIFLDHVEYNFWWLQTVRMRHMALWAGHQLNTALARGQPALKKTTPQHLWAMCEPSAVYCYIIWTV